MDPASADIIMFSRDRWDDVPRRRHNLAAEFAAMGRRVLFVEPPRRPALAAGPALRAAAPGVHALALWKTAPHSVEPARLLSLRAAAQRTRAAARRLGMHRPLAWVTAEFAVHMLRAAAPRLVVYDVTDDWTQAALPAVERRQIAADDAALLRRADIVFAVSRQLAALKEKHHSNVHWLPNGVQPELYEGRLERPAELSDVRLPIVGYAGTLHADRLDVDLVVDVAARGGDEFVFVLVGPDHLPPAATRRLLSRPNVRLLPPQPAGRLPSFIAAFDVCAIPHLVSPFTDSLDPIKLYEYLAAGGPVVSTPVQGVMPYVEFVSIAGGAAEFHEKILAALRQGGAPDAEARRRFARENSWKARARTAMRLIDAAQA